MDPFVTPAADTLLATRPGATNAWKHGMYARRVVVPAEDRPGFEALRQALVEEWRPRSVTAWMLVDHLAKLHWRLMRATDAEAERLTRLQSQSGVTTEPGVLAAAETALAWDAGRANSSLQRLQMFQMRLERSIHRVITQLITLLMWRGGVGTGLRAGALLKTAQPAARPGDVEKSAK
ncbi:MAG: hypothetical protein ACTHM6_10125 [Tepidisphaeraceae bacterium]